MIGMIYGIVIFIATFLGALVGLGGGVIIKPVLDFIGLHSTEEIALLSAFSVFSMSIAATARHLKNKTPMNVGIVVTIAAGSILGGFCGNKAFFALLSSAALPNSVKGLQSAILAVLLAFVIVYVSTGVHSFHLKNKAVIFGAGFLLGMTAAFLGIGGGPINVAFLALLFSFPMKDAAVYSVAVIFFSQLSNLTTAFIDTHFAALDLKLLLFAVPCAILGGLFGARFNRKCSEKVIQEIFTAAIGAVAILSAYNAVNAFIR